MLPVVPKEPINQPDFESKVRAPGLKFLMEVPRPKGRQWRGKEYWRNAISMMRDVYGGVCQYSSHFVPDDTGANSVEHFLPKDHRPDLAYEWSNFRFVCGRLNGRRGTRSVVDPMSIPLGLFEIVFPALLIRVGEGFDAELTALADATIGYLGLNDETTCVRTRVRWFGNYKSGAINFAVLEEMAPFLAFEIKRQNIR